MRRRLFLGLVTASTLFRAPVAAQQRPYRLGYLALAAGEDTSHMAVFLARLQELRLSPGKNLDVRYRSAEGDADRLSSLASELVRSDPDILVAGFGTLTARALKAATGRIPIVFTSVGDPIKAGLVSSLARPGANLTGLSTQVNDLGRKRVQLLRELVPSARKIGVLMNPQTPITRFALQEVRAGVEGASVTLTILEVTAREQIEPGVAKAREDGVNAILVLEDPLIVSLTKALPAWMAALRLPAMYGDRAFVEAGGLMSYGPDRRDNFRRAAEYVHLILGGAKPADLAIEQPTKFELLLNLRAARAIGHEVPLTFTARADEVID